MFPGRLRVHLEQLLTTKDLAEAIGASESSLRRWTDSGAIKTARTPGGHRRIPRGEAIRFIRETRATVVRPEILGLTGWEESADAVTMPAESSSAPGEPPAFGHALYEALRDGDALRVHGLVTRLFLAGHSIASLCDGPVRRAMEELGALYKHEGAAGIFAEHRATDLCMGALARLRHLLPDPAPDAPVAVGGTTEEDAHLLPSLMAATSFHEAGWRAVNIGAHTPTDVLALAASREKARVVWLSVSVVAKDAEDRVRELAKAIKPQNVELIVGGRGADGLKVRLGNVRFAGSMAELQEAARLLRGT